jgi:general secretion pathway protein L
MRYGYGGPEPAQWRCSCKAEGAIAQPLFFREFGRPVPATTEALTRGLTGFLGWWGRELCGLLPGRMSGLLGDRRRRIVLAAADSGYSVFTETGGTAGAGRHEVLSREEAGRRLAALAASHRGAPIGLRLPLSACYSRHVQLPAAARADFARILALELERATPFRAADILAAHTIEDGAPKAGRLGVHHLVVRRQIIDDIRADVAASGHDIAFADCWNADASAALPVDFLATKDAADAAPAARRLHPMLPLAAVCAGLAALALYLDFAAHQRALDTLTADTAQAKSAVQAQRRAREAADARLAQASALHRLKRERLPAVLVLDEITRLVPDDTYLTDLRLEGDTVDITGLSRSAAALLPILERSAAFMNATLTSPLTLDPQDGRERFSVRLKLRPAASAAKTGGG